MKLVKLFSDCTSLAFNDKDDQAREEKINKWLAFTKNVIEIIDVRVAISNSSRTILFLYETKEKSPD